MRTSRCGRSLGSLAIGLGLLLASAGRAEDLTPKQLIDQVSAARQTSGFRVRARLVVVDTTSPSPHRNVKQLLIKSRRDGEATSMLYQVLWPTDRAGSALVIEKSADHQLGGFLFEPPATVTPLTAERCKQPFFESDLTIEDLAEEFWQWPSQQIAGDVTIDKHHCKILESRPPAKTATTYSLVKTAVAPDLALPLRIEKFDRDGKLVKRISADKLMKRDDGHWTAANIVVEPASGGSRTILEGTRSDRDIVVPAEEFTVEKIKAALRPSP